MAKPPIDPFERARLALDKGGEAGLLRSLSRVQKAAEQARGPFEKLAAAMGNPAVRKAAGAAMAVEAETRRLNAQVRARVDLEARKAAVMSGSYAKELRANQVLYREQQKVFELERRAQYETRFGKLGGRLAYGADALSRTRAFQMMGGAVTGAATAATHLGLAGFDNTVEWNRLRLEVSMISRELAGAFLPAIRWSTAGLQIFRKFLESLGPRGQNLVMLGALGAGGLATAGLARMGLGAVAGVFGGRALLGAGGAAAAGAAGRGRGLGGLGPVAAGAGLAALGVGKEAAIGGLAFSGIRGALGGRGVLGGVARGIGAPLAIGAVAHEAVTGGYYEELRARGHGRLTSGLGALGGGFMDLLSGPAKMLGLTDETYGEAFRRRAAEAKRGMGRGPFVGAAAGAVGGAAKPDPDRRKVTIADAGFDAPGTAYERIANKFALVDAERSGAELPKTTEGILTEIWNFLKETFGGAEPPAPPAMR